MAEKKPTEPTRPESGARRRVKQGPILVDPAQLADAMSGYSAVPKIKKLDIVPPPLRPFFDSAQMNDQVTQHFPELGLSFESRTYPGRGFQLLVIPDEGPAATDSTMRRTAA